jgi:hypothetical protein
MGHSAHALARSTVEDRRVEPRGILHRIEDDLSEDWVEEWADGGVQAIERYLAKHLAFLSFLDEPTS